MSASSTDDYSDNLKKDMRYSYGKTPDNKGKIRSLSPHKAFLLNPQN
jgi:hypothetical protein